ncbi:hypothetical protein TSAR_007760, partial [Trichomalopsis sarcophagae]
TIESIDTLSEAAEILKDHDYFKYSTSDYASWRAKEHVFLKPNREKKCSLCKDCIATLTLSVEEKETYIGKGNAKGHKFRTNKCRHSVSNNVRKPKISTTSVSQLRAAQRNINALDNIFLFNNANRKKELERKVSCQSFYVLLIMNKIFMFSIANPLKRKKILHRIKGKRLYLQ